MTAIQKITIPKPCHQSWLKMTPNNEGRHCSHCSKTVVDFANMTDAQLIKYLVTNNDICGRFGEAQLNRVNMQLDAQNTKAETGWEKWLMAIALFGSTVIFRANGQNTIDTSAKIRQIPFLSVNKFPLRKVAVISSAKRKINGQVFDDNDKPLHGATIRAVGTDIALPTDTGGRFSFHTPASAKQFTVSFVGFETQTITIDNTQNVNYAVKLIPQVVSLNDEVVVKGYGSQRHTDIMGSVATVTLKKHSWWWRMYYKYMRQPLHKIFY
jgi:hypothetical protein